MILFCPGIDPDYTDTELYPTFLIKKVSPNMFPKFLPLIFYTIYVFLALTIHQNSKFKLTTTLGNNENNIISFGYSSDHVFAKS